MTRKIIQQHITIRRMYHLLLNQRPWVEGNMINSRGVGFYPGGRLWECSDETTHRLKTVITETDKLILTCAPWLKIGPADWENF